MQNINWTDKKSQLHQGIMLEEVGEFKVIDCTYCKFSHVIPIPTPEELKRIYSHEYYSEQKPFYISRYLEDEDWWTLVYSERYNFLEKQIKESSRRILDVGSGPGLFLEAGRKRGWETLGIEPSEQASTYSRNNLGLDIRNIFLDSSSKKNLGLFSVINMGEVLEHLPDPKVMIEIAKSLLLEDGILVIVVPNDFNPIQRILSQKMGMKSWWVAPPHHLNYFNLNSLSNLVSELGFTVLHAETTFPIDIFLLMGLNYIGNDALGRQVHEYRKKLEINLSQSGDLNFKNSLYKEFCNLGLGREIVLYARIN